MARRKSSKRKESNSDQVQETEAPVNRRRSPSFCIVGIGASAGGLEALMSFLSEVPENSGASFILVQHLDPSQPSRLTELLGRASLIPVHEVTKDTRVEPDHVYVISPGSDMIIRDGTLRLQPQSGRPGLSHSIDVFFGSLAEDAKEQAVAIILSGTGSDGTNGARAIKAARGLVIVQDPESAKYDGMPRAAISAGVADYVLKPEAMASQLLEYGRKSPGQREDTRYALEKDGTGLRSILSLVRARTGRDFSGYKVSSITRRIERRMAVNRIETNGGYLSFLQGNSSEIEELVRDFLINVTSFFRDKEAFDALKKEIGEMFREKPEGSSIRAWIPGCSTGEEAYSLAMLLVECAEASKRHYDIQVFGTDLDTDAITSSRAAIYPATIAQDVSPQRLQRFFNRIDASYQVKKDLRERVIFAVHDLVSDPPYSRIDIVSVRNLLIYFDTDLQKRIIPLLHYSLNEGGILFLGTAETIGEALYYFTIVDSKWRIYRAVNKQKAQHKAFADQGGPWKPLDAGPAVDQRPRATAPERLLLEALPPSVLLNRNYQVIYTHGNTGSYLRLPEGNPRTDILEMANPDLRTLLATALHEASQRQQETVREGLHVEHKGGTKSVKITVHPLGVMNGGMIVMFEDVYRPKQRKVKGETPTEERNRGLEQELQLTKETLRGTIEELETANEELRSANEEYMSTNEELKSANEELQTSREEMRSVNEELTTISTEREKKIEELTTVSDDMRNLLNSVGIATIFLNEKLCIRRFTPAATALFKFIDSDVGRPLEDIASRLTADSLPQAARRVLETLIPVQQEVQAEDGHWYSMRIHPYRTADNNIEGVVATFVDIDQIKNALSYAQSIIDTVREPMLVLDEELKVVSASLAFYSRFLVTKADTEGQPIFHLGNGQWDIPQLRKLLRDVLQKDKVFEGFRIEHDFPVIGQRVMLLNARRVFAEAGAAQRLLLAMEDITGNPGPAPSAQREDTQKRGSGE